MKDRILDTADLVGFGCRGLTFAVRRADARDARLRIRRNNILACKYA